jgi:signal transduction histidine kinase
MSAALALAGWGAALGAALARSAARRTLERRMALVARACHEVRGPLTAARLGLHLAGRGAAPLEAIDLELGRAGLALDDLAAAGGGRPALDRREPVDVAALAREAAAAWGAFAARHGAGVSVSGAGPGTAWVRGDRLRLAQALGNLLANAAEHGGGRVDVGVGVRGDRVRLAVQDGGAGLPGPVEALLRAGPAARRHRGARGHGLAVAAEVADRHGGRLAAAPSPRGACLVLELPAAGPPP